MAEDKFDAREVSWRHLLPWTELFRGYQIALDFNKLVLAAAGIFVMAFGWWLLAFAFSAPYKDGPPTWPGNYPATYPNSEGHDRDWAAFKQDRDHWNIMHEATGVGRADARWAVEDLAQDKAEFELVSSSVPADDRAAVAPALAALVRDRKLTEERARIYERYLGLPKRAGTLATWPWWEDRGPNPYLLVTGQAGIPWEPGHFWDWLTREQAPVIIEPLVKLLRPLVYLFSPRANTYGLHTYFFLVLLWTIATWSLFGGAITRIAAVQVARGEKTGMTEALRFTLKRYTSYLAAPLFPIAGVVVGVGIMWFFGYAHMIPYVGDIFVSGVWWFVMIVLGALMAIALVGLVGWPLMPATISAQGTDSWEAVSRSYSYVYQRPWQYIWCAVVAIAYGGIVVFFIGFFSSFTVYLSKWGVAQTPGIQLANREPSFLFVYAPTTFGWRTLLLQGVKVDGENIVQDGLINKVPYDKYLATLHLTNRIGAGMVAVWLGILLLFVLGFGYSFFWCESTIIYLLLRKQVDAEEMDEVHLEEDEEGLYADSGLTPSAAPAARTTGTPLAMVEPPVFRPSTAPEAAPAEAAPAAPAAPGGDGNPPPAS